MSRVDPSPESGTDPWLTIERLAPLEVRWFVPGRLPKVIRAGRACQSRTDEYYTPSLASDFALKRRNGGPVERKWLVEPPRPVLVDGRPAVAERWLKERTAAGVELGDPADWQPVRKTLWRTGCVQLAEIIVEDSQWWTLAFRSADGRFPLPSRELSTLVKRAAALPPSSYPAWLLERRRP